jgi:hypothetical protein
MLTIVDIVLEADPANCELLQKLVQDLADQENPKQKDVARFVRLSQIFQLHFLSMQIFEDHHFDPLLVFENNFDGDAATYWDEVLRQIGQELRSIFACTKEARLSDWKKLFEPGSQLPLVDFIQAHAVSPSASHLGAPAMPLQRIRRDRKVFADIQVQLGNAVLAYRGKDAVAVHQDLRRWALSRYDWLPANDEQSQLQAAIQSRRRATAKVAAWGVLAISVLVGVVYLGFGSLSPLDSFHAARAMVQSFVVAALVAAVAAVTWFVKRLRHLELTDFTQDHPNLDATEMKQFARQEDQIVQNHLAGMVLVKPGMLRGFTMCAALWLLKSLVPIIGWNGYLGSMRTIHFAHWTLIGNNCRLLFLSNFDGSWQSYLDDFVDKAHGGLTLAWGNCVGFPRTRFSYFEGATHGTQFKNWARQSQTQSLLWYSAYPDLTVNQITRNAAIVDGLRKASMTTAEAEEWTCLL